MDAHYTIRVDLARDLNEQVPIYAEAQAARSEHRRRARRTSSRCRASPDRRRRLRRSRRQRATPHVPSADAARAPPRSRRSWCRRARGGGCGARRRRWRTDRARRSATAPTATWEIRIPVTAGPHEVQVAFVKQIVGGRRNDAAAVPASLSGRRQHRRDADRRVPAQRRDRGPVRSDRSRQLGRAGSGSSPVCLRRARTRRPARARFSARWPGAPTVVR